MNTNSPKNTINYEVSGRYALFTDPLTRAGGEKCSYHFPTYEAIKGITESIYWKPTFTWIIDKIRVMEPIRTEAKNMKPINLGGGNSLATYTYLSNVRYQVSAHFEWNLFRDDLIHDRIDGKHWDVAKRMLKKGGRRDIFLGTRECQGYVEPVEFGDGTSYHDQAGELAYGLIFHGFDYPDTIGKPELHGRFWNAVMKNGVIKFPRPDDNGIVRKFIREMTANPPQTVGLNEKGLFE
ncbi:MAG: type I-C CRISPR-associated protein Cas5c [Verrucomicrobiales bacterium]|nr:type I-C CRISPR-associated protein Cas5c [Verrucomicrobiales bacterium]